jgi:hypothetical protein
MNFKKRDIEEGLYGNVSVQKQNLQEAGLRDSPID